MSPLAVTSPEPERTSTSVAAGTRITIRARQGPKVMYGQLPSIRTVAPSLTARRTGAWIEPFTVESIVTYGASLSSRTTVTSPSPALTLSLSTGPGITWCLVCSTAPIVQPATCTAAHTENSRAKKPPVASASPRCERAVICVLVLQVAQHGEHAAVRLVGGRQAELEEDVRHVLLDGALGDDERLRDQAVGAALGHQCEDFPLARGERFERVLTAGRAPTAG